MVRLRWQPSGSRKNSSGVLIRNIFRVRGPLRSDVFHSSCDSVDACNLLLSNMHFSCEVRGFVT